MIGYRSTGSAVSLFERSAPSTAFGLNRGLEGSSVSTLAAQVSAVASVSLAFFVGENECFRSNSLRVRKGRLAAVHWGNNKTQKTQK